MSGGQSATRHPLPRPRRHPCPHLHPLRWLGTATAAGEEGGGGGSPGTPGSGPPRPAARPPALLDLPYLVMPRRCRGRTTAASAAAAVAAVAAGGDPVAPAVARKPALRCRTAWTHVEGGGAGTPAGAPRRGRPATTQPPSPCRPTPHARASHASAGPVHTSSLRRLPPSHPPRPRPRLPLPAAAAATAVFNLHLRRDTPAPRRQGRAPSTTCALLSVGGGTPPKGAAWRHGRAAHGGRRRRWGGFPSRRGPLAPSGGSGGAGGGV